jgi:hypothetical protein
MYPLVNRNLILIKPKKPFLDWAKFVDTETELSDKNIEEEYNSYTAYLIKYAAYDEELDKINYIFFLQRLRNDKEI